MATTTVRLPEPLKLEAEALAASLGISLNALMAVALRDYLDRPVMRPSGVPSASATQAAPPPPPPVKPARQGPRIAPPPSRSDPCPCGARDFNGYPVKFKHCHGR
jgi:hypothetical protein